MKILRREDGSALIEFALVMPIFIVLLVGVLDYGVALQKYGVMADSVRAGAQAALIKGNYTNITVMQNVATASAATANITNYSPVAINFCTCSPGSGSTVSCATFCPGYGQAAMYAQVTATGSIPLLFGHAAAIPATATARVRIPCPSC